MGASAPEPDANASHPGLVLLKATCQSPLALVPWRGGGRCPICLRLRPKCNCRMKAPDPTESQERFLPVKTANLKGAGGHKGESSDCKGHRAETKRGYGVLGVGGGEGARKSFLDHQRQQETQTDPAGWPGCSRKRIRESSSTFNKATDSERRA